MNLRGFDSDLSWLQARLRRLSGLRALTLGLLARFAPPGRLEVLLASSASLASEERLELARRVIVSLLHEGGDGSRAATAASPGGLNGSQLDAVQSAHEALCPIPSADPHCCEYGVSLAARWLQIFARVGARFEGARVLELGAGYTLIPGLLLHAHGAAQYTAVDLYPALTTRSAIYRRARNLFAMNPFKSDPGETELALRRFDAAADLSGPEVRLDSDRVSLLHPVDASCLPFADGAFDLLLSHAAFEHFRDPATAAREAARVLAPGGLALHQVDLRDHRDFSRPHESLTMSDEAWERSFQRPDQAHMFTNRLRLGELRRLFQESGCEVLEVDVGMRAPVDPALRQRLAHRFRRMSDEELSVVSALFVLRRTSR